MYETKKNSGRKDIYKYQKSSYPKNFHNSSHFGYHKYNKYKQKYNHSNSIQDFDEEAIFSKIFEDNSKNTKKIELKEVDELTPVPTLKACKTLNENKENISLNMNTNELSTKMKTNDINDINVNANINEINKTEILDNISSFSNSNNSCCCFNSFSDNLIIDDNFNKTEFEIKEEIINEINNNINNLNNLNNLNFNNNGNNINFNVDNAINDFLSLQKNNECLFTSNDKENINLEYKKNIYKTPQSFKVNSSSINLSSNDMKEAYYFPKKQLNNIYDTHQPNNFFGRRNSFNHFNFMTTIQKPSLSLSNKQLNNYNNKNIAINNKDININYFKNNNNNNNNSLRYNNNNMNNGNNNNNNMNSNFKINIPGSPNIPINSFNVFDNSINNIQNIQRCLTHNQNNHHNNNNSFQNMNNKNPFHNMMPQFELNQCILKTQINNNNLFEKDKENTDILEINVKISEGDILTFKIRRYDDMFKTVKIFCEINKLDIKLIRPFIIYIIRALNSVYGIYNLNLKTDEIQFLKDIKKNFYNDVEEEKTKNNNDIKEGEDKNNENNEKNEKSYGDVEEKNLDSNSKELDEGNSNSDEEA